MTPPLRLPVRDASAHKGAFGRALLVGGSRGMSGSIAMSSIAALHCGSGLVTAAVPDRCLETVAGFHPALMTVPMDDDGSGRFSIEASASVASWLDSVDAVGCGPGMTTGPGAVAVVDRVVRARRVPRVLDADAINVLAMIEWLSIEDLGSLVLTPHPGEFARISDVPPADRDGQIRVACELANKSGAVIVLKGGPTVVIGREGTWTNSTGNPGMATAGCGDVLTGMVTSLLGQGLCPWDAARLAVWVHGRAGDVAAEKFGQPGLTATAILDEVPVVIAEVVDSSPSK